MTPADAFLSVGTEREDATHDDQGEPLAYASNVKLLVTLDYNDALALATELLNGMADKTADCVQVELTGALDVYPKEGA